MSLLNRFFGSQAPPKELGRNESCWCGSGKKYKSCHLKKDQKKLAAERARQCVSGWSR